MDEAESKRPEQTATVGATSPAGGMMRALERAQSLFARLALAGLVFFVLALVLPTGGRATAGFNGFLMVAFFGLYVMALVASLVVRGGRRGEGSG